jgi:hypothetical protein
MDHLLGNMTGLQLRCSRHDAVRLINIHNASVIVSHHLHIVNACHNLTALWPFSAAILCFVSRRRMGRCSLHMRLYTVIDFRYIVCGANNVERQAEK